MLLFYLIVLGILFWCGFKITGALLTTCLWLFIGIPLAVGIMIVGLVLCCTIILLPLGIGCFKAGLKLLVPVI